MYLGFSAYRFNIFNRLSDHKKYIKRFFWYSLLAAVLMILLDFSTDRFNWGYVNYYDPWFITILSTMIFILSSICWLYVEGKFKRFFNALQFMGKNDTYQLYGSKRNILLRFLGGRFGFV